jgi:hypothetical protein
MTPFRKQKSEFSVPQLQSESALSLRPQRQGQIPQMAVMLGLITPKFFEIYNKCDGEHTIREVGQAMKIEDVEILRSIDRLVKSRLVKL